MNALSAERWSRLWIVAARKAAPPGLFDGLLARYAEPHRHYHNQQHIAECLLEFDREKERAAETDAVELAIWFHDAGYDPRATDNEERSAELAVVSLQAADAPEVLVSSVRMLVLATKTHDAVVPVDAPVMIDLDLSILGRAPQRFREYEAAIRREYAWVAASVFAEKRAELLESFLARPRLFATAWFYDRYEAQARRNLRWAVDHLKRSDAVA